jgi:FKBP-type peptidyl-prolyl cis-trans isomerase FkpA
MKKGRNLILSGLVILMIVILSACTSDDVITDEERLAMDIETIDNYLSDNGIAAITDESGLRYVIHEEGEGISPEILDEVHVRYMGMLLGEANSFDSSDSIRFPLNRLIEGWRIGFQLLQEGDSATLYIPSVLGYGTTGSGPIPPNSNLEFIVKLIQVDKN